MINAKWERGNTNYEMEIEKIRNSKLEMGNEICDIEMRNGNRKEWKMRNAECKRQNDKYEMWNVE